MRACRACAFGATKRRRGFPPKNDHTPRPPPEPEGPEAGGGREDDMIPAAFVYHRPKSIAEAVALLSELGEDARPLSGGHSLIPMMKLRLAKPSDLVDLGTIAELKGIREDGPDIVIGATTTQHDLLVSALIAARAPILAEAASVIADPQVRYLGTIGGNVANGDPGNDMPAVMMCLGATFQLSSRGGDRHVAARDF